MSWHVVIRCDRCGEQLTRDEFGYTAYMGDLRNWGRSNGWTWTRRKGDRCPTCSRSEAQP